MALSLLFPPQQFRDLPSFEQPWMSDYGFSDRETIPDQLGK
jgi:hypothetical protein